jgi:hypothetical protein
MDLREARLVLRIVALPARYNFLYFIKPAHGAGVRRLCGAACLLSSPRLAAPGGALRACGQR